MDLPGSGFLRPLTDDAATLSRSYIMTKPPITCRNCGTPLAIGAPMKRARSAHRPHPQVDREVSDVDVFEHVIFGVRMNHILQILRETDVLAASPPCVEHVPVDDPDDNAH